MEAEEEMVTFTDEKLRAFFTDAKELKPTTIRPYLANLTTLQRYCGGASIISILSDGDRWYPIVEKAAFDGRRVHSKDSKSTLRTLIKTIMALLKYSGLKVEKPDMFSKWARHFAALSVVLNEKADMNEPTESTMTWPSVIAKLKEQKLGTIEHVTLSLYVEIPPRRQQDYWKLLLHAPRNAAETADCTGYLDFETNAMTITAFKTVDTYDTFKKDMPAALVKAIKAYVEAREKARVTSAAAKVKRGRAVESASGGAPGGESKWLFCRKSDGEAYTSLSSFTDANNDVVKRALDNPHASVNTMRHAAASFVATSKTMLRKEKKDFAYSMGHSLAMQSQYVIVERDD